MVSGVLTAGISQATGSTFLPVGFFLDAKPPVNRGSDGGARPGAERRSALL
jgi:hypothetical protein